MDMMIERLDKLSVNTESQKKLDDVPGRTPFHYDPNDPDKIYVSMHGNLFWYKPRGDNWAEWSSWFSANKLLLERLPVGSEPYKICWKLLVGFMPKNLTLGRPTSGTIAEQAESLDRYLLTYGEREEELEVMRYEPTEDTFEWREEMRLLRVHIRDLFDRYAGHNNNELARNLKRLFRRSVIFNSQDVGKGLRRAAHMLTTIGEGNPFRVYRSILAELERYESFRNDWDDEASLSESDDYDFS